MRSTKSRARFGLLVVLVLLLMSCFGFVIGKYITTIEKKGVVTFSAELAENVELRESKLLRNEDGTYSPTGETITSGTQKYILIPGLDVPKDPYVVISGKSEIPAYLFIEVIDKTPNETLEYELTENWKESDLRDARNEGAALYVYCSDKVNPTEIVDDYEKIEILKDNIFYVNQALKGGETSNVLTFFAYLEETAIYSSK